MKIGKLRIPSIFLLIYLCLSPGMFVSQAMAQDTNLFAQAWNNLGPTFFIVFLILILAGLMILQGVSFLLQSTDRLVSNGTSEPNSIEDAQAPL